MIIRKTRSVCPVCFKNISAVLDRRSGVVFMEKTCPEHGDFSVPVWHDNIDMDVWRAAVPQLQEDEGTCCPDSCGICADHRSGTCCALLEVTERCNLSCRYCFANGGTEKDDPSARELKRSIVSIAEEGGRPLLQLSGGEPTLRDDLPELVAYAKACGCPWVQLNTNGIRLANDEEYVRELAAAGLSFVFLQFDGVTDDVYEKLRGEALLETKKRAIDICGRYGLGVTLVPTVVRGINDDQLGDIIRFGISRSPVVRGVHFQPVTFMGRFPDKNKERYTLDELITNICSTTGYPAESIVPSHCDHPMCGFHSSMVIQEDGTLLPLTRNDADAAVKTSAVRNREFVGNHWSRPAGNGGSTLAPPAADKENCCGPVKPAMNGDCCCGPVKPAVTEESCCCGPVKPAAAEDCCCGNGTAAETQSCCCGPVSEPTDDELRISSEAAVDMDSFLARAKEYSFTLTSMAFMDGMNFDIERLKHCSLHVWHDGKLMPFCARYLRK